MSFLGEYFVVMYLISQDNPIQSNLPIAATQGTQKKWLLLTDGRYSQGLNTVIVFSRGGGGILSGHMKQVTAKTGMIVQLIKFLASVNEALICNSESINPSYYNINRGKRIKAAIFFLSEWIVWPLLKENDCKHSISPLNFFCR